MISPESYVDDLLGPGAKVTIGSREVTLADVVALPHSADLEDLLRTHPDRVVVWQRLRAKAHRARERLRDELRELESLRFIHYYRAHEDHEREEWARFHGDEAEGDKDQFGRVQAAKTRIARGEQGAKLRWRRNFSDDLVWAFVRSDEAVTDKRLELRLAQDQVELCEAVCEALDHRARCISHLAAIHRDLGKAG